LELVNRRWVDAAAQQDPTTMPTDVRHGIERTLNLSTWLDIYRPQLRLP
jgi:asparagine synthase (glutamine-hydrolysing)